MSFVSRLFGKAEEVKAKAVEKIPVLQNAKEKSIPAEKVGLDGNFDESGLAKRVAKALDDANISDEVGLWVAQEGSVVVLKYNEDAKSVLSQAEKVARGVDGATTVKTVVNS